MKNFVQLDDAGYFVANAIVDESPLEPGVYLIPAKCIEAEAPEIPKGKKAKWQDGWVFEDLPKPPKKPKEVPQEPTYAEMRSREYPSFFEYLDGIVKGDKAQVQAYIDACLAIKEKYPKPQK